MKFIILIFISVLLLQCQPRTKKHNADEADHGFIIYYGFKDYNLPVSTGLSGKYDHSWTDFLQTATLDTCFILTDNQIEYLDPSYSNLIFRISKADSLAFFDLIKTKPDDKCPGLFIVSLKGKRLFAGQVMPMAIAAIPEYPQLRFLNYPPDTDEQILELWGQGYDKNDAQKIIEHFQKSGKIKSE